MPGQQKGRNNTQNAITHMQFQLTGIYVNRAAERRDKTWTYQLWYNTSQSHMGQAPYVFQSSRYQSIQAALSVAQIHQTHTSKIWKAKLFKWVAISVSMILLSKATKTARVEGTLSDPYKQCNKISNQSGYWNSSFDMDLFTEVMPIHQAIESFKLFIQHWFNHLGIPSQLT